jgi:hypothetical protein
VKTAHVRLLVLGLSMAALAACYWGYRHISSLRDAAPASTEQPPAYHMLYSRELKDFSALTAKSDAYASYTLNSALVYDASGKLLGVNNPNAQPIMLAGQDRFRFSVSAYQMALVAAQNLPYTQEIDATGADPGIYGLRKPRLTITLTYKTGSDLILDVGSRVPSGGSDYVQPRGSNAVYLVPADLFDTLGGGVNRLHEVPGAPGITPEQVIQLRIEQAGAETIEIADKPGTLRDSSVLKRKLYTPFEQDVNPDRVKEVLTAICALAPAQYAGYAADTAALAAYGLDTPAARVILRLNDDTIMEYRVGMDTKDGLAYFALDRSGDVYTVSKDTLSFLNHAKVEYLADQFVSLVTVTAVDSATVEASGETYTLGLTWPAAPNTGSTDALAYSFQGMPLSKDAFSPLYKSIISILFDKRSGNDAVSAAAAARVTFSLHSPPYKIVIEYLPYDIHYYSIQNGAGTHFLVRREKVDNMVLALREAAGRLP